MASRQPGPRTRPGSEPKASDAREPTGTALDRHEVNGRADAVINGGLNTV